MNGLYKLGGKWLIKAMYSKSSTFLALTSILAILAVLSIAINDMQSPAARKPFATSGKGASVNENGKIPLPDGWDSLTNQVTPDTAIDIQPVPEDINADSDYQKVIDSELKFTPEDQKYFQENFKGLNESIVNLNLQNPATPANTPENNVKITESLNEVVKQTSTENSAKTSAVTTDLLVRNVNSESLRLAGYSDFVIKPKPLEGKLFGEFDVSMLDSLGIIQKNVLENRDGTEYSILNVYEFNQADKDTANEIYDFLKAQIKSNLNVSVNETNQFGLSSFYINFNSPKNNVFLVVKTRDNVYALSYPKANSGNKNYSLLTANLLKELI